MSNLTFYELTNTPGSDETFSPHVWKTKVDLAILGVNPDKSVKLSFPQIRGDLSRESGNDKITVPAIKTPSGEYITDSFAIAEYLDKEYGKEGKRLFPGDEAGHSLIKFLEQWVNFQFGAELRPLIGPKIYAKLDQPSKDYWLVARFSNDPSKLEAFLEKVDDPQTIQSQPPAAREKLQLIESLLNYNQTKPQNGGWLLGAEPSHADALLFGWYAFSRVNPIWEKELWGHESLPLVKQWVEKIKRVVGEEELPH